MSLWILAIVLAFAPGIALLWYIRHLDRYEPEPWSMMGRAFFAGILAVGVALLIGWSLQDMGFGGFIGTVWSSFITAAMVEEVAKGGMAYMLMWRRPEFSEVMDGVVYFGVAHMGFAITENLLYIFRDGQVATAVLTGFARSTTAVPLHVVVGMIMGYHMGEARYASRTWARLKHLFAAFVIPILLHGFYNLAVFNQAIKVVDVTTLLRQGFGVAMLYAAVVALWLFLLPRLKKAREASPYKPLEMQTLPTASLLCPHCDSPFPEGANYCPACAGSVQMNSGEYPPAT